MHFKARSAATHILRDCSRGASVHRSGFMRGGASAVALVAGLAVILGALFAIGLWPKWNTLKVAQAEAGKDDLQAVAYVVAKRGSQKADLVLPASLYAMQDTVIYARTNGYLKRWLVDI